MKNNELNNQAFANYVRKVRRDKELSQLCMANLMNISQNAYCLIENGHTKITLAHIQKIAHVFTISEKRLLENFFNNAV